MAITLRSTDEVSESRSTANWRLLAACRGLDTQRFFPGRGESVAEAKAVCANCEVRTECAEYALNTRQRFGIWGGTSERDRRRTRRQNAGQFGAGRAA